MATKNLLSFFILINIVACTGQDSKNKMEIKNSNPLLCNPQTGECELPAKEGINGQALKASSSKALRVIYFTDPICSSCWGIEAQLRKLKLEYGKDIEFEYHMGGLLPDWSYNSGGISKPSDVAHHWDEVSQYYQMPIDGDVWLEDPLHSSYPPSIAFKAAQIQNHEVAIKFLRKLRELLFLQKKNITKWEIIEIAASHAGLDVVKLKKDYEGRANELFKEDLNLAKQMGVRGFPTIFIVDSNGNSELVYGFKPYEVFEKALLKMNETISKFDYKKDWFSLFEVYPTLTLREFTELSNQQTDPAKLQLNDLEKQKKLLRYETKNGDIWIKN